MLTFILPLAAFQIDLINIKIENEKLNEPYKNEIVIIKKTINTKELKKN